MYGQLLREHLGRAITQAAPQLDEISTLLVVEAVLRELVKLEFVSIYEIDRQQLAHRLIQKIRLDTDDDTFRCDIDDERIEDLMDFYQQLAGRNIDDEEENDA